MAGERTKSAPFLLASPFAVLLLWTMELLAGGTSYDARVSLLSLGLASLLSLFLAWLSLRGGGWRRASSFLPLLVFAFEAATLIALLLEAGFSYGVRIDGGFFLVGKGIRLVGTGQAVPYPGGEGWMYGKDLYSYPFRFDVPIAFLILLVLFVLYRKETKGWVLRFLRMDGEGLLALVLILPFALVSMSRLLGAFHLPTEGYLRVLFLGFLLEALLFFLALWRGQATPSLIALALAFLEEHMRQGSSIPSSQDALFLPTWLWIPSGGVVSLRRHGGRTLLPLRRFLGPRIVEGPGDPFLGASLDASCGLPFPAPPAPLSGREEALGPASPTFLISIPYDFVDKTRLPAIVGLRANPR